MAVATLRHEVDARMDDPPASNVPERWCDLLSGQSHFKRSMGSCLWGHLLIRVLRGDALLLWHAAGVYRRWPPTSGHLRCGPACWRPAVNCSLLRHGYGCVVRRKKAATLLTSLSGLNDKP